MSSSKTFGKVPTSGLSSSSGSFTSVSTSLVDVTNLSVTVTVPSGSREVMVVLQPEGLSVSGAIGIDLNGTAGPGTVVFVVDRGGTIIFTTLIVGDPNSANSVVDIPPGSLTFIDTSPGSGSVTYKIRVRTTNALFKVRVINCKLYVTPFNLA